MRVYVKLGLYIHSTYICTIYTHAYIHTHIHTYQYDNAILSEPNIHSPDVDKLQSTLPTYVDKDGKKWAAACLKIPVFCDEHMHTHTVLTCNARDCNEMFHVRLCTYLYI